MWDGNGDGPVLVALGNDAGPSKLATIRTHNLKAIDEDGLYQLIRTLLANGGDSKLTQAAETKRLAEKKVMELAKGMARTMTPLSKQTGKGKVKEGEKVGSLTRYPALDCGICADKYDTYIYAEIPSLGRERGGEFLLVSS